MIRVLGTVFAALLGLAFGSFLNVCLSRWPEGESIVHPRSHCRQCGRTLAWWENVPLVSWIALRGRCRGCATWIGWRYVIVEFAVGTLWAIEAWRSLPSSYSPALPVEVVLYQASVGTFMMAFMWLMVALAVLDAEHLWLPNWLTWPGIVLGVLWQYGATIALANLWKATELQIAVPYSFFTTPKMILEGWLWPLLSPLAAAMLILLIRWLYWLIRRREGLGLGDAKLMALLAAWLGLPGALLAFGLGVVLGALLALIFLLMPRQESEERWGLLKLPLGTFLCIGGIINALWGQQIIAAYLGWAAF
jgi:leader peptidase (prepilin peptidase)/N-methyltransferase